MALSADRQVQIKVIETADYPVLANTVCYAGGFVGDNASGYARGLVTITAGTYGNVIRTLMPLVISDAELGEGLDVLEASLAVGAAA